MKKFLRKIKRALVSIYKSFHYLKKKNCGKNNLLVPTRVISKKTSVIFTKKSMNNVFEIGENTLFANSRVLINGKNNKITIGKNCKIKENTYIEIVGDNCSIDIGDNVYIRGVNISLCPNNNHLVIGGGSFISYGCVIGVSEETTITIGKELMCSSDVMIRSSDGHLVTKDGIQINKGKDVVIEDHVWLNPSSTILKGAYIPRNSIVSSYTLVNKKYDEPNVLLAGQPAEIKKRGINWVQ